MANSNGSAEITPERRAKIQEMADNLGLPIHIRANGELAPIYPNDKTVYSGEIINPVKRFIPAPHGKPEERESDAPASS